MSREDWCRVVLTLFALLVLQSGLWLERVFSRRAGRQPPPPA
jgi:hypothetical protein